jgi:hypothetical protein
MAVQRPQPKPGEDGRIPDPVQHPVQQRPPGAAPELEPGHLPIDPVGDRACLDQQPSARPWPAAWSAAPARSSANATSDTRSGAGRSGARSIDSRVDRGRLMKRLTGPSASFAQ